MSTNTERKMESTYEREWGSDERGEQDRDMGCGKRVHGCSLSRKGERTSR